MGKTKRRRRTASSKNTILDNSGVDVPWSDLNHDALLLVMMRLGIVEFFAFNGVCKSWRSLAVSNKNKFIVSRPPMSVHFSGDASGDANKEECHFKDFEGRKFKPIIPHYAGRRCIGVTSGYLMLLSYNDLRLVNLITRHEINFPQVPGRLFCCDVNSRTILVFSPSISGWVLLVLNSCYYGHDIWFAVEGRQEWIQFTTPFFMYDLHAFKGKIYAMQFDNGQLRLSEMRLYPKPELVLLETESIPGSDFESAGFASWGENLYVIGRNSRHPYMNIHELDFGEMKLVPREKEGKEYAFFLGDWDYGSVDLPVVIIDLRSQYGRYGVTDKNKKENLFYENMWYFFHDCLNANLLHA